MKIATVVGARPQFIKAASVSRVLRRDHQEILIHTGQHYDTNMSDIFFDELHIPRPDFHLGIGSGRHGAQTGAILEKVEEVLIRETPDALLVYGDTNSTLAGALAASKLHIPVIHIEAGLRSFNRRMPEEINRILTDHVSSWLSCPTETAVKNLAAEGITKGVSKDGDVMYDAFLYNLELAKEKSNILQTLGLSTKSYILCTIHRAENTDDPARLTQILRALAGISLSVVLPLHPRTRKIVRELGLTPLLDRVKVLEPVGYLDMIALEAHSLKLVTDSGGVQKEAYFAGVPCITMRDETEWVETVDVGWNRLTGADEEKILEAVEGFVPPADRPSIFGDGKAAEQILTRFGQKSFNQY